MSIVARGVTKRFGSFLALDNVTIEARSHCLTALLGPSGSGKTTLLRVIAGLEVPDAGAIHYHDEDVTRRAARHRNAGFVFQHYALFRHMSVYENVAFGLRIRGRSRSEIKHKVGELLHLVGLDGLEKRFPSELSGGQRQRVALARALAIEPKILLLDEPFGALDAKVRAELRRWLRRLHDEIHVTSIFVTHDQEEAFEVADQVVIMRGGRIEQVGSPREVFDQPANAFVMDFLGNVNVFTARVQDGRAHLAGISVDCPDHDHPEPRLGAVYVRPHELEITRRINGHGGLKSVVRQIVPAGPVARVRLVSTEQGLPINVDLSRERHDELSLKPDDVVYVYPRNARVFIGDTPKVDEDYSI